MGVSSVNTLSFYLVFLASREVKTVNAWFQNKRASSKKRSNKGASNAQYELPSISTLLASVPPPSSQLEYDELSEDEHPFADRLAPISSSHDHPRAQSLFYAGNPQHRHLFENESNSPRKGRSRPSAAQTEELRKLYDQNHHPSKEEREELGDRIGMYVVLCFHVRSIQGLTCAS